MPQARDVHGVPRGLETTTREGESAMIWGIEDPVVTLAYLLSIAGMVTCAVYGWAHWNRGDEPAKPEDVAWAKEEKEDIEKSL